MRKLFPRAKPTSLPGIVSLTFLTAVAALNMSIFLPSLSVMADDFDVSYALIQVSISGYLTITAILQLIVGPLSDRYGRRPVLIGSLLIFLIASVGCVGAGNIYAFLFFRILQGAVISCIVLSRAIIRDIFSSDQAASMLGYVTMGMSLVPMLGPVLGGALQSHYSWRASFVVLTLVGILALVTVYFRLAETAILHDSSHPKLSKAMPELIRSQRFWAYVLTAAFSAAGYYALLGGGSYVADHVFGLNPVQTGLALAAPSIGYLVGNGLSGRYAGRLGIEFLVYWGSALIVAAMVSALLFGLAGMTGPYWFFGPCILLGLGNGLVIANCIAGLMSVRPRLAGTASGIGGAFQIGGGAIFAILAGLLLEGGESAVPLQVLMAISAVAAMFCAAWARRRERAVACMG